MVVAALPLPGAPVLLPAAAQLPAEALPLPAEEAEPPQPGALPLLLPAHVPLPRYYLYLWLIHRQALNSIFSFSYQFDGVLPVHFVIHSKGQFVQIK